MWDMPSISSYTERPTHDRQLLVPLRESIIDKPPYTSGIIQLPNSCFSLFYKPTKDGNDARYINLANATHDELEQLTEACDPASFGLKEKEVLDETYRKAGKMDPDRFASLLNPTQSDLMKIIRGYLLEGKQSSENIVAELHKLNVYSKGSFFKPHVDTPRGQKMFGSLVLVFPTPHEGGSLLLRHRGNEWIFESGRELTDTPEPSIGYIAFFSDVEHEVTQVISGHRVTLTYNLYFDDGGRRITSTKDPVSEYLSLPPAANEDAFRETFQGLLENPEFLPDGGTLAFGLRHFYPISDDPDHPDPLGPIYGALKGSDAVVYQTAHALGLQPMLYIYYQNEWPRDENPETAVSDKVIDFSRANPMEVEDIDAIRIVLDQGGTAVYPEGWESEYVESEQIEWVTPMTTVNRKRSAYVTYGNEPSLEEAYGDLCMFVRIGKADERLEYPTISQLRKERRREPGSNY